jgi:hypothetical protein
MHTVLTTPATTQDTGGFRTSTGAKFIVPDWGDKVDSGIGLLYRPARLHRFEGLHDNVMPE